MYREKSQRHYYLPYCDYNKKTGNTTEKWSRKEMICQGIK